MFCCGGFAILQRYMCTNFNLIGYHILWKISWHSLDLWISIIFKYFNYLVNVEIIHFTCYKSYFRIYQCANLTWIFFSYQFMYLFINNCDIIFIIHYYTVHETYINQRQLSKVYCFNILSINEDKAMFVCIYKYFH